MKDVLNKSKAYPQKRLAAVYNLCKTRKVCEGGDVMDKEKLKEDGTEDAENQDKVCTLLLFMHLQ